MYTKGFHQVFFLPCKRFFLFGKGRGIIVIRGIDIIVIVVGVRIHSGWGLVVAFTNITASI